MPDGTEQGVNDMSTDINDRAKAEFFMGSGTLDFTKDGLWQVPLSRDDHDSFQGARFNDDHTILETIPGGRSDETLLRGAQEALNGHTVTILSQGRKIEISPEDFSRDDIGPLEPELVDRIVATGALRGWTREGISLLGSVALLKTSELVSDLMRSKSE